MFGNVDIQQELEKERAYIQQSLLTETGRILQEAREQDLRIAKRFFTQRGTADLPDAATLDPNRIFTLSEIRNICIRYRMRFLPTSFFKGDIPYEAIIETRKLEQASGLLPDDYKILAPRRLFDLPDADADPMLFAPTSDGRYYLIHKWGTDMKWHRRMVSLPLRSMENMLITLVIMAGIVALITPTGWIVPSSPMTDTSMFGYWGFHRMGYFIHVLILLIGFSIMGFFTFHRHFSNAEWDRKTFN
ncbi:MAG: hypothetical protein K1X56_07455 [Flavobacteriales bacterium]|nr:hypothetical protein [Flavobacteriales bacterium]